MRYLVSSRQFERCIDDPGLQSVYQACESGIRQDCVSFPRIHYTPAIECGRDGDVRANQVPHVGRTVWVLPLEVSAAGDSRQRHYASERAGANVARPDRYVWCTFVPPRLNYSR
jgi:hypothetical protein